MGETPWGLEEDVVVQTLEAAFNRYDASPYIRSELRTDPQRALNCIARAEERRNVTSPFGLAISMFRAGEGRLPAVVAPVDDEDNIVRRTEQWVRNAGAMYDRWEEVEDEIFNRKRLAKRDDLVARFYAVWQAARPGGEAVEAAELERAEKWKQNKPEWLTRKRNVRSQE